MNEPGGNDEGEDFEQMGRLCGGSGEEKPAQFVAKMKRVQMCSHRDCGGSDAVFRHSVDMTDV